MEFVLLVSQMFVVASCGFLQGVLDFGYIRQAHRKGKSQQHEAFQESVGERHAGSLEIRNERNRIG
jgi:hypothetical protein